MVGRGRPPKSNVIPSRKIWVDADNCPAPILEVLYRMATTRRMILTLVASRQQRWPDSAYIRSLVVAEGFDSVTSKIATMMDEGDLVVTDENTLAKAAAAKKARAITVKGETYVNDDADKPQSVDSFMNLQLAAGHHGIADILLRKDQQSFATRFDHVLTRPARMAKAAAQAKVVAAAAPAEMMD